MLKSYFVKIVSSILIISGLSAVSFFGYEQYKIYDFQKRYKEAPIGSLVKTGNMKRPRSEHANILLKDGTILVVGGNNGAEIFTPKTGQYKLIDKNLENISFAFNNYYILNNGNVLIANKYLFDFSLKKFFRIQNFDNFYKKQIINGNEINFNNTYYYNGNLILSNFISGINNSFTIYCYDSNSNLVKPCNISKEQENYFIPFNNFYAIEDDYLVTNGKYNKNITKKFIQDFYFGRSSATADLSIIKHNGDTYSISSHTEIPLYNTKNILHDKNGIWVVDKNSNLLFYDFKSKNWTKKIKIPKYCNQTKMYFYKDEILFISPIINGDRSIYIYFYSIKENKINDTLNFKYSTCSRSIYFIRSYDVTILNNSLLINGGQYGIPKNSTAVNDSYIIKI